MSIEDLYSSIGSDYEEVFSRLPSKQLIEKFIVKFVDDKSYSMLIEAMEAGNREDAFLHSHTLKGVAANLGFKKMLESVSTMTEVLRDNNAKTSDVDQELFDQVKRDYEETINAIATYIKEK